MYMEMSITKHHHITTPITRILFFQLYCSLSLFLCMQKMAFRAGQEVEVCSKEEGFVGSYYEGTVIKQVGSRLYKVQYKNLVEEEDESIPLIEAVSVDELRPMPQPKSSGSSPLLDGGRFYLFDQVDAFDNDGWWVGNITGKQGSQYYVYFPTTGDHVAYHPSRLRGYQDWIHGEWIS